MRLVPLLFLPLGALAAPTPHNDHSCDIAALPAATLLLPYFEVDLDTPEGESTLFTVTNVTNVDQVARVTLWTDAAFPVFSFDIYLTGYDVQAINLYDVLVRGIVAPDGGTGTDVSPKRGPFSDRNAALDLGSCNRLPGLLDPLYVQRMQDAFTLGVVGDLGTIEGCAEVGMIHDNAVGYATVDVVGRCNSAMPNDAAYWSRDIRYDNVLIGDYQQVQPASNAAQGGPMVHIRAVPEGGTPESRANARSADAGFDRTFYAAFQSPATPRLDGRQPLPSQFAARWILDYARNDGTTYKIWREGGADGACADVAANLDRDVRELVIFDESENATIHAHVGRGEFPFEPRRRWLPSTSRTHIADSSIYPRLSNGATSGWMYFNLDSTGTSAAQSWVVASMHAQRRYSVDMDAVAMGNGCSTRVRQSEITRVAGGTIGPAPNESRRSGEASTGNDDSCDVALLPAATLLLPYFEVDLDSSGGETTLFTVTNVSASERIARVTLWTDYAVPIVSFNIYLTGYDVQSISLYDVLAHGRIGAAATGRGVSPRGPYSNVPRDRRSCDRLPEQLSDALIDRMRDAFTLGRVDDLDGTEGCDEVGNVHDNAVGYATVDLVRNCSSNGPEAAEYWSEDLAFDNVLMGDYQQVNAVQDFAQGSPMVHVRAVPEGGTAAERVRDDRYQTAFPRTFYSRFQSARTPKLDGRQPLPTTFAARWIQGGTNDLRTALKIWREAKTGRVAGCGGHDENAMKIPEIARFDEAENVSADAARSRVCVPLITDATLPATSLVAVADASVFPQLTTGAIGGWMYLNLDHCVFDTWGSQNWIVASMRAQGRYSVDSDVPALGNGCSPQPPITEITVGSAVLGPAPNRRR